MLNNHNLNIKTNKATAIVSTASTSISIPKNIENDNKSEIKRKDDEEINHENVESYLVPWTYSCLFKPAIERVKHSYVENQEAVYALNVSFKIFINIFWDVWAFKEGTNREHSPNANLSIRLFPLKTLLKICIIFGLLFYFLFQPLA
ncbi:unnamed protein product [Meloidogyne enterolobii]|uniref:Uncharacterized protein n=1 Tax=Meloidogyne enterolobii TaxID=390850 RepID=A0ACB0XR95_MELEN